jgi:hypothetical protein
MELLMLTAGRPKMVDLVHEVRKGYARGWSFTPLNGKNPILIGWQKQQRADLDRVVRWASRGNVGMRTGSASGIVVVDIDGSSMVSDEYFPPTVTAGSGSGRGWHLYYRCPEKPIGNRSGTLRNKLGHRLDGVDLRGDGGQVVFVGSVHPKTGLQYFWKHSPDDRPIAPFPAWLIREVTRTPSQNQQAYDVTDAERRCMERMVKMPDAVAGSAGHAVTFYAACTCWRFGMDEAGVFRCMTWWNANKSIPPWTEKELAHKVRSSYERVSRDGEIGCLYERSRKTVRTPTGMGRSLLEQLSSATWTF